MTGAERIAAERKRQIEEEGWTPEHDAQWEEGELARAGVAYAEYASLQASGIGGSVAKSEASLAWPWDRTWLKLDDDPIRNLEKAGALIAAEIDRLEALK